MQAKQRYILVFICCVLLILSSFRGYRFKNVLSTQTRSQSLQLDSYIDAEEVMEPRTSWAYSPRQVRERARTSTSRKQCRMETCFDFSKCFNSFKVFVHPPDGNNNSRMSPTYRKILNVIMESR